MENQNEIWYDEDSGLWWFDQNNRQHFGYDVATQTVLEEWLDLDEEYHCRVWKIGEYKYSHSDWTKINALFQYLSPKVNSNE